MEAHGQLPRYPVSRLQSAGPFKVGHCLTAGEYDRKGLERFWVSTHRTPTVGMEIALSLLESELVLAWHARRRPHPSVQDEESRKNRLYRVSCIRGLLAAVISVAEGVHHRRPNLPITKGRT